ncbi:MAG: hypothetical protein ACOCXM_08370 [Myxococcota bacterium]
MAAVCFVTAASMVSAAPAHAQQERCIEQLNDDEVESRYQKIYRSFEQQQKHGRWWYLGWLSFFTGTIGVNTTLAFLDGGERRPGYIANVIGAGLSLLSFTIFPRTGILSGFGAKRLRAMPAKTSEQRRERLVRAEEMLEKSAFRQKLGTSFLTHAQGYAWGLGAGLVVGLKFDDTLGALTLGLAAPAVNEARALTTPTQSIAAWESYRTGVKHCMASPLRDYPPRPTEPSLDLTAGPGNVSVTLRWF